MDSKKIENAVRDILESIGEDPQREGLKETPARVARMYEEVFSGLSEDPRDHLKNISRKRQRRAGRCARYSALLNVRAPFTAVYR